MLDLLNEFRALVQALEAEGAPFAVCGGLAVAIHARPRATLDVDLLVPPEALEPVRAVARRLGYGFETLSKPDPETGDLLSLDLLLVTPALREVWENRERVTWAHGTMPVVSRAGLITMKRLRGSGQDEDDIRALESNVDDD